ncbi:lysosomal-associated transmembrane protein 5 [Mixophyes fleayi]|uniref:lysosomal-associated transmembrane protein 5 n=1 Tax=Mixophyes fleayi TaxID=3061075 RepID=UPI003F4D7D0A
MTPETSKGALKLSNFKGRAVAHILAIYHGIISIFLFIEYSVEMKKNYCCLEISKYNEIVYIGSGYLLLVVLFLISILLLCGIVANRGYLVMPFMALQIMDLILSSLVFCSVYSELPSTKQTIAEDNLAMSRLPTQSSAWGYFEMSLRVMTFCSCYVEVPNYLNLKSINYMNYFLVNKSSQKYVTRLIIITLLHTAVFLYKVLMIWCLWRVFKSLNASKGNKSKDAPPVQDFSKVALPSYEEAIKTESKDCPPPYSTV